MNDSDERGDWARKFFDEEEVNDILRRGDQVIENEDEIVSIEIPFNVNEILGTIELYDRAMKGDKEAISFFSEFVGHIVDHMKFILTDIGIDAETGERTEDWLVFELDEDYEEDDED